MKRLLLFALSTAVFSIPSFSHEVHGEKSTQPMGMMVMPHDPETMKLIQEHKKKCKKELMQKLAQKRSKAMAEHMLRMMAMHPEAFKKVIQENPQLKEKLRELVQ